MPSVSPDPEVAQQDVHEQGLHHQLTAGQMTMVAVGGSIGTGLLLGSAAALEVAGPGVILSYIVAAFIAYTVSMALGELASMHPAAGSFGLYGELYLNQYLGFLCRAAYWAAIAFSIGAELVASATYMAYWFPAVPGELWVILFSALLLVVNLRSVLAFGRFEFWFAMIKFATIVAFILAGAALLFSGRVAPQYTAHGGFLPKGPIAPLLAVFWAIYAFGGVEMLAVTTGESHSSKDIPRATRLTIFLLAGVYLGAITVLVGVMPWNHTGVSESPFVSVLRVAKVPAAAYLMNFVVLTAALSGANAKLYVASRLLFSMGRTGWAPASMGKLNSSGSPRLALLVSSYGIVTALIIENWAPQQAFLYIMGAAFSGLIFSWVVSLAAHVSFRWRLSREQIAALPMRSPLGVWGSILGFVLASAAVLHTLFASRVNAIGGFTFFVLLTFAYVYLKRSRQAP
ncbi:MAG: amino acid permease [Candidatus Sulfotelmatobacter sp.]|jgi:L-asparagine transporter-like permease